MKYIGTTIAPVIYFIGFISVHIHLLRFGIFEISTINLLYFLVGSLALLTLFPSVMLIVIIEIKVFLDSLLPRRSFKNFIIESALIIIYILIIIIVIVPSINKDDLWRYIFNFNLYLYPKYFVVWNIFLFNVQLLLIWLILFLFKKKNIFKRHLNYLAISVFTIFIFGVSIWFGRTIYPVINSGIGGGAPIISKIISKDKTTYNCLILHRSSKGVYLYKLDNLTQNITNLDPLEQYALNCQHCFYKVAIENDVIFIPNAEIKEITLFGENQKYLIDKYHSNK